jgi:chaperonin cofactor prefoldin
LAYADRMEKQIATIEVLIKDKQQLQDKVETLIKQNRDYEIRLEGIRGEIMKEFKVQLTKEKEIWAAREKVNREKWEADKV